MNNASVELHVGVTELTPTEHTLFDHFKQLPLKEQLRRLRVLLHWEQAGAPRQALALKLLDARLTDKSVSQLCGLSDRQLRRYVEYRAFVRLLRQEHRVPLSGRKDRDGRLEAWVTKPKMSADDY